MKRTRMEDVTRYVLWKETLLQSIHREHTAKNSEVLPSIDKDIVKVKKFKFIPLFV